MKLQEIEGKLVVVTGGSSGIGLAIAEQLAARGARLLLVARDEAKLANAAGALTTAGASEVQVISADLTREADVRRLAETVRSLAAAADLVVNSAGIVSAGLLHEVPLAEWDRLHNINVRGLLQVLQLLLPDMIAAHAQDGQPRHIVNIASAAGFSGVPGMAAYGATKAAVIALGESLRAELTNQGIGVSTICPGFVQTPIAETVQLFGSMNTPKTARTIQKIFTASRSRPEHVATATLKAIAKNQGFVTVGPEARGGHWLKRLAPATFSQLVARSLRV